MAQTKACNLTKEEIEVLIKRHGTNTTTVGVKEETIDRINYLYKRLKSFDDPETKIEPNGNIAEKANLGWGNSNA